jgi:Putative zinc- or iron-chelating domain
MTPFSTQPLLEDLARAVFVDEFHDTARHALAAFDVLNTQTIAQQKVTLACREGCSLCCWLRVDGFAHEIFLIADHVRRHFTADEMADLLGRLATHAETVLPLTPFAHATMNVRCPLLVDGRCSVYAVRPQACRRHHSRDFAPCQFTFDHPTDLAAPAAHDRELFRALTAAMQENIYAYAGCGFDHTIYELGTALAEALSDPASWERWRNHEQTFISASVTPAE